MSKYGFRLKEPRDLVMKLEREFERFEASTNHKSTEHRYQSDHAFNFVITAWHIVDWLWKHHKAKHPNAGAHYGVASFRDFHSMVREECSALDICYDLATGSKHFKLNPGKEAKSSVAGASARVTEDSGVFRSPFQPVFRSPFRPAIGYYEEQLFLGLPNGETVKAIEVFGAALDYWRRFLKDWYS